MDRSGSEIAALLLHPAVSCQPQPTPSRTLTGPNTHQPRHLASVLCPHLCFSPPVMCEMSAVCSLHAACLLQERGMLGGDGPWVVTVPNQYRCLTGASSPPRPLPGLYPASPQHLPGLHDEHDHSPCLWREGGASGGDVSEWSLQWTEMLGVSSVGSGGCAGLLLFTLTQFTVCQSDKQSSPVHTTNTSDSPRLDCRHGRTQSLSNVK